MNKRRSISNRAALNTSGHSVSQGGLRGHSIGPLYPYSVEPVYTTGWRSLGWTVRNLLTGEDFLPGRATYDQPAPWRVAFGFAKSLKQCSSAREQIECAAHCLAGEVDFPVLDNRGFADRF